MTPKASSDALPVRAVIAFVGCIGTIALIVAAWLAYNDPMSTNVATFKEIVLMAMTGLLALLGRTTTDNQSNQRRADAAPAGTPADPMSVEAVGVGGDAVVTTTVEQKEPVVNEA